MPHLDFFNTTGKLGNPGLAAHWFDLAINGNGLGKRQLGSMRHLLAYFI